MSSTAPAPAPAPVAPAPAPAPAAAAPRQAAQVWWHQLEDEDPISLEPLAELSYPPFELRATPGAGAALPGEANRWFDGRMLASYLVSTGCFLHPISRRELALEECEALDAYLLAHSLGTGNVAHTFSHKEDYTLAATPHNRVARLREEATGILAGMFANAATGGSSRRRAQGRPAASTGSRQRVPAMPTSMGGSGSGGATAGGSGLVVIDGDEMAESRAINDEIQTSWPSLPTPAPKPSWAVATGAPQPEPEPEPQPEPVAELPPLANHQVHFFGVRRRMAVESFLWSMREQCELRWLDAPPDGLWTTEGDWAIAAFEDPSAFREMGSRLGGGIRGLFSVRVLVVGEERGEQTGAEPLRVFLRAGRTRKTKEALVARDAAEAKRLAEAPAKAAAAKARAERAAVRRKERAAETAQRQAVRRVQEAAVRVERTQQMAEERAALLEARAKSKAAAAAAAAAKAAAKAEKKAAEKKRRMERDRKETVELAMRVVGAALGGTALLLAVCWLLEPWRRLTQVASACGKGMREQGLRGIGAVGCMEPLIIIAVLSLGAGVFALRLWLETGPSSQAVAARRHLAKHAKKQR